MKQMKRQNLINYLIRVCNRFRVAIRTFVNLLNRLHLFVVNSHSANSISVATESNTK